MNILSGIRLGQYQRMLPCKDLSYLSHTSATALQ